MQAPAKHACVSPRTSRPTAVDLSPPNDPPAEESGSERDLMRDMVKADIIPPLTGRDKNDDETEETIEYPSKPRETKDRQNQSNKAVVKVDPSCPRRNSHNGIQLQNDA
jgi:hypothetical protein